MLVQHQASGKCPGAGMASPVTPGSDVSLHELRAIASVFAALHRSSPGPSRCSTGQLQRTGWDAPSSTALMLRARPMGQRDRTPEPIPRSGAEYGHQFPPTLVGPELEDRPRKFGGWLVIRWHVARQARSHKLLEPRAVGGRRSVLRDSERPSRASLQPWGRQYPHFRFYAGAPVHDTDGFALGSICVIDFRPRKLDGSQRRTLLELAAIASDEVKLRADGQALDEASAQRPSRIQGNHWARRPPSLAARSITSATAFGWVMNTAWLALTS